MSTNEVSWVEITIFVIDTEGNELGHYEVIKWLREHCDRWVFQLEKCPTTESLHYQMTCHLIKKQRTATLAKAIKTSFEEWRDGSVHVSPTVKENINNHRYSEKAESRVKGPWRHDDVVMPKRWDIVNTYGGFLPLQKQVYDSFSEEEWQKDSRTVNVVVDTTGKSGKNTIANYLQVKGIAHIIRTELAEDKMKNEAYRLWKDTSRGFILNIERAAGELTNAENKHLFAAIKYMKDGYFQDPRFGDRPDKITMHAPIVWIYMNGIPNSKLLSADRWVIWKVNGNKELEEMN